MCSRWIRPVDLRLRAYLRDPSDTLSVPLQNNLLGRTAQDMIQGIHLDSLNPNLLTAIVSFLTLSGEGIRERSIESIILSTAGDLPDLSNFFARSHLPKLQHFRLSGSIRTPLWIHLGSQWR